MRPEIAYLAAPDDRSEDSEELGDILLFAHSESPYGSFLIRSPDGIRTNMSRGIHTRLATASQPKSPL